MAIWCPRQDLNLHSADFKAAASADLGYEGWYPWQDSNLHQAVFETTASAGWATGTHVGAI
jgi:hypothetical protein